jgi:hypothetical protein
VDAARRLRCCDINLLFNLLLNLLLKRAINISECRAAAMEIAHPAFPEIYQNEANPVRRRQ